MDFLKIATRSPKRGVVEIYPKFRVQKVSDLMIRGGDFYAIWIEEQNIWSLDEHDAIILIDNEIRAFAEEYRTKTVDEVRVLYMWDASSRMIDDWHKYCQKQMRDGFKTLDEKLVFSNMETKKKDYVTRKLAYPLEKGDITYYNKLMSTLYSEDERFKIEWAIGAVVSGESVNVQKFVVLYGAAGTGKSTVLNIIQKLFDGYYSVFDAKALGSTNNSFALESFKTNPLVAIQHDGDLSRIEDNTRLNSLVSHELMTVNEKFKSTYSNKFKCFLFMGTNKPVKITDAKSGLIRRLIDVSPSGEKLSPKDYKNAVHHIDFELGAIAYHCKHIYMKNKAKYDNYIPTTMLGASNDFYNFMEDAYFTFKEDDGVTMKGAWDRYKTYCDEAKVQYPFSQRAFKEELRNYFKDYQERFRLEDGTRVRSYFNGFRHEKFENLIEDVCEESSDDINIILFNGVNSPMDANSSECPAQYASPEGKPVHKWEKVKTKLKDLDTSKLHYVILPENHIVIDFDLTDANGDKSLELNLKEASKWPETYAEVSKSGCGIHLHYIYSGDATKLSRIYDDHIEVKVSVGNGSLRRKLTLFNDKPINTISSGLPLRGVDKMINFEAVKNEKAIRTLIYKNLNKESHPSTKSSIDFIHKILEDAYNSDLKYDVSDLKDVVFAFAASSSHQSDYCINIFDTMHFKAEEPSIAIDCPDGTLIFYDVEVFPNLFVICWKKEGPDSPVVRMINPSSEDVEKLLRHQLVGFNCRRYDNHILYGRHIGYNNKALYDLSQKIISGNPNCYFGEAWNISYTDVYDFSSEKKSLKKFEIDLGIHHQELGLPWEEPVPEELWPKVAEYCDNDVIATEAVFHARSSDFLARQILALLAKGTVNQTTNLLSTQFVFKDDKHPQSQFNYRDMGKVTDDCSTFTITDEGILYDFEGDEYSLFNAKGQPVFPGYKYEGGKSTYRGEEVGEGGHVYSEPGMYTNVQCEDIAGMHPTSIILENLLGDKYTKIYQEILDARLAIKHKDFDAARKMLNGALIPFLVDESVAKDLAKALKIVLNSFYGLTAASFENRCRDPRNIDNIVAKRGALFMINLKHAVQDRGFQVVHIKTDSIKIQEPTPDILRFIKLYGEAYGYTFETESLYERFCLVNNAVYIAKENGKWHATGTQFAVPYVFKKLFSGEDILFEDLCETKSVTSAIYLDMNEKLPDVTIYEKEKAKIWKELLSEEPTPNKDAVTLETRMNELNDLIAEGHNYMFIGKVGSFCPIKPGCGGGHLMRETVNNKTGEKGYAAVTGTKGFTWLEAEMVTTLEKEADIDRSYYDRMVDDAVDDLGKFGDVEWFLSEESNL